jgi:hypothetical protein
MLPNKSQTGNVTSGFKSTFISGRNGDVADRRSIDDSLDGGSNLEAGKFRFNSDDAYVGTKIANVLAILTGSVILFFFLRSAFLAAVPAISRIVGGR